MKKQLCFLVFAMIMGGIATIVKYDNNCIVVWKKNLGGTLDKEKSSRIYSNVNYETLEYKLYDKEEY